MPAGLKRYRKSYESAWITTGRGLGQGHNAKKGGGLCMGKEGGGFFMDFGRYVAAVHKYINIYTVGFTNKHLRGLARKCSISNVSRPRKYLIGVYRLKGLQWVLYRTDFREGRWAELPKLLKIAEEGDEYELEITGRKRRQPNAPGPSRKRHFDRPNSKNTKRDFIWNAPDPRVNAETQVRLADAGHIGYREAGSETEERRRIRVSTQKDRNELLKARESSQRCVYQRGCP
jgi:hypothetical protein